MSHQLQSSQHDAPSHLAWESLLHRKTILCDVSLHTEGEALDCHNRLRLATYRYEFRLTPTPFDLDACGCYDAGQPSRKRLLRSSRSHLGGVDHPAPGAVI